MKTEDDKKVSEVISTDSKPLPCPFCSWENIRIIEDEKKDAPLIGSKYTYCWCIVCGTKGPWAYSTDDDVSIVYRKCVERWNERTSNL